MEGSNDSIFQHGGPWLRAVIDTAVDGIIIIDALGRVQLVNPACEKLFGYPAEEVVGRNVKLLMPPPFRDEHDDYLRHYLETGDGRIIGSGREVTGRRKDGDEFPLHLSIGEIANGGDRYFVGIVHDITDRREAELALRRAQKMEAVGQLSGGIAHDFNNLLTVVLGSLEILEPRLERPRDLKILRQAREAAQLGSQLTHRLLAFARRQPLEPRLVDLNSLVLGMSDLLRRTVGEAIGMSTVLANDLGQTRVDPGQVESALLNLSINARDAMPGGGTLTIETRNAELDEDYIAGEPEVAPGAYVQLSVTDTGAGMPPEVLDRAFEPFFTTKEVGAGSGLGLSMIYGFAKQSDGHVRIYSEAGHGTSVSLYLPRVAEATDQPRERGARESPQRSADEIVLVVEDDPRVRMITVYRLEELGYRVLEAADGPSALAILQDEASIDLLFSDLVMPGGMTGQELGEEARRLRPGIGILYTTGYAEAAAVKGGLVAENEALIRKPYTTDELARKIRSVLEA